MLLYIAEQETEVTARQVLDALRLPKSSVYRLLDDLEAEGWLRGNGIPKRYGVSLKAVQLGLTALRNNRVREAVMPNAIDLARATGAMCAVSFYEDGDVLHTDWVQVLADRVVPIPRGERAPAASTASGKILLAHRSEEEIDRVLARGVPKLTGATKTDPDEIRAELAKSRAQGFGLSNGEHRAGSGGLSVAVFDATGAAVAALGILAPTIPVPESFIEAVLPKALAYAARASAELGFRPGQSVAAP